MDVNPPVAEDGTGHDINLLGSLSSGTSSSKSAKDVPSNLDGRDRVIASVSTVILAFFLIICMWDTWSTFTDIIAPINQRILLRTFLNILLFLLGAFLKSRSSSSSRRIAVVGNLVAGIGIWEMIESVVDSVFVEALVLKFIFYSCCMLFTFSVVVYLEKTERLNVMDSEWLSPI